MVINHMALRALACLQAGGGGDHFERGSDRLGSEPGLDALVCLVNEKSQGASLSAQGKRHNKHNETETLATTTRLTMTKSCWRAEDVDKTQRNETDPECLDHPAASPHKCASQVDPERCDGTPLLLRPGYIPRTRDRWHSTG